VWHSSAQVTKDNSYKRRSKDIPPTKKQPTHFSFAVLFDQALQSNLRTEQMINNTPKGDSVGCFGKGALHWNEL